MTILTICVFQTLAGDYNVIIRNAGSDGIWIYEDPSIEIKDGDVINYWILVIGQ